MFIQKSFTRVSIHNNYSSSEDFLKLQARKLISTVFRLSIFGFSPIWMIEVTQVSGLKGVLKM